MAKTKRKWIVLDYNEPGALRAEDIPYDASESVKDAIDRWGISGIQGTTGLQGIKGDTGFQGHTGIMGGGTGLQGQTGLVGAIGETGYQGYTGIGLQGNTGLWGDTGIQGLTGPSGGPIGETGVRGETGIGLQGQTGFWGGTGLTGLTGIQGDTGVGLQGYTGLQGATGLGGGTNVLYNTVSRYDAVNTSGEEVWLVSSSTVYTEIPWTRSGTNLTLNRTGHGHAAGDRVIVRNSNVEYQTAITDSTTANDFTITTADTGSTSGNSAAYSLGFIFDHNNGPSKTGGTLSAPSGDHADVQLLSMRLRTGPRSGTTYDLVVPASAINGAGDNTSLSNCYVPDFNVRNDGDSLAAIAATIATNIGGSFTTFRFGNLGTGSLSRFLLLHF